MNQDHAKQERTVTSAGPKPTPSVLPQRVYLDGSTLQAICGYGAEIFDGHPIHRNSAAVAIAGLADEIASLKRILNNQPPPCEFVVTAECLRQVSGGRWRHYRQWIANVENTWLLNSASLEGSPGSKMMHRRRFDGVSVGDRRLVESALNLDCDTVLTMNPKLSAATDFIHERTGLQLIRPSVYWRQIDHWGRARHLTLTKGGWVEDDPGAPDGSKLGRNERANPPPPTID
ncbi:MAG: hypothetical protein H0T91_08660 [Propionibacteriaceae bacterium]|nr:hypothetical protein [Propionibacteriaceae bacterium]